MVQHNTLNWEERDTIIFGESNLLAYAGGVRHFNGLTLEQLDQLLKKRYILPDERQNNSPTVQEICEFMKRYTGYTAIGYAVSPQREDCRVTLEGIEKPFPITNEEEFLHFRHLFRWADELVIANNYTRCWYD